ncbi:MAG: hypothetical protein ABIZ50_05080 [Solirubrobacterales bacterium]
MLFDIRGKRKRVVQVIYVSLALLMGVGLVGLGIGGNASGGLFDAIGLGGNSATTNPSYDKQIDKANETLATNPQDEKALLVLARYQFLSAQTANETGDRGQVNLTEESVARYNDAIDAWKRYLATKPQKPDDDVASLIIQAYQFVIDTGSPLAEKQLHELVGATKIVAEARPSVGTFSQLAVFAYLAQDTKIAADAEKKAIAQAPDDTTKKQIQQQLAQAKQQGALIAEQINQGAPNQADLQDPTAQLGGATSPLLPSGTGVPGATPPSP